MTPAKPGIVVVMAKKITIAGLIVLSLLLSTSYVGYRKYQEIVETSQPQYGGEFPMPGLEGQVSVEFDARGVPTIRAEKSQDAFRVQGYLTARDRFFQMDIIRRRSAGRLAEILGEKALEVDQIHRRFQFEKVANEAAALMSQERRAPFQAFSEGVNWFLETQERPFEIQILDYVPKKWSVRDSFLIILSMFEDMDYWPQAGGEIALTRLYRHRPKALADFLTSSKGFMDNPTSPDGRFDPSPIPSAEEFDFRKEKPRSPSAFRPHSLEIPIVGSNGWVLSGSLTKSTKPILAGDPHLGLMAPNIWYRLKIETEDVTVLGVTIPGIPAIVIGSTPSTSWALTNAFVDNLDLVLLSKTDRLTKEVASIGVSGNQRSVEFEVSEYGPVAYEENGQKFALQWAALDSRRLGQLDLLALLKAKNSEEILQAASRWRGPNMNLLYATQDGDIGWTILGSIPKRVGFRGHIAEKRSRERFWDGYYESFEHPVLVNPPTGRIVSGNQRMIPIRNSAARAYRFGNNWPSPVRSFRISERLKKKTNWETAGVYDVQLDVFSHQIKWFQKVLLQALSEKIEGTDKKWIQKIKKLVSDWDGMVRADSGSYLFLRRFRDELLLALVEPLWGLDTFMFVGNSGKAEEFLPFQKWYNKQAALTRLVENRPTHLLSPEFRTYDEAIVQAALRAAKNLSSSSDDLGTKTWGEVNQSTINHPFSLNLPRWIGKFLMMPIQGLPGDHWVPRVSFSRRGFLYGASMRMVVDLKEPMKGIFNHPTGQSGFFKSPHYGDQFADWAKGVANRFEPGPSQIAETFLPVN